MTASSTPQTRQQAVASGQTDLSRWADPQNLETAWEPRSRLAATLIPRGSKVIDLGCGRMFVERYLHPSCEYWPADVVARDARTLHCDINRGELPEQIADADIVLMLGVIEYVYDLPGFMQTLARKAQKVVVSYCDIDTGGLREPAARAGLGWVNSHSIESLRALFNLAGFKVVAQDQVDNLQWLYTLVPVSKALAVKRVGVLTYANVGNFGDRLGMHLLSSILPSHAEIERLYFRPWNTQNEPYDLLVLGIGNSMFAPLINVQVMELVERSKASIGIFGTQYREEFAPESLKALIGKLDVWYARYEDDLERYAVAGTDCRHLGDWLIREFMMTRPTRNDSLTVGKEVLGNLPLDRVIQDIQQYGRVYSERLHPLLCALTSANEVAYKDQRESGSGHVAGKFQSMLRDVFGRVYPEGQYWGVDRDAVMRYRNKVMGNVRELEGVVTRLLG